MNAGERTREELAAVMIYDRLQEELAKLPPHLRGHVPGDPAGFPRVDAAHLIAGRVDHRTAIRFRGPEFPRFPLL